MHLNFIKNNREFRYIYNKGTSLANRNVVCYKHPRREEKPRFGVSISGKVGIAVVRNRIKRQIKEILAEFIKSGILSDEYDIIFIVRVRCAGEDFQSIRKSVYDILRKQQLIVKKDE
ncbi:MAG: ribonuclease P protein component [Eubacteriaceae bacterium]|nr:ribonuclease P protein component [Eubacteriaceae bacterium]